MESELFLQRSRYLSGYCCSKTLFLATELAKYSFMDRKSITYLDLNLQEYTRFRKFPNEDQYVCKLQGLQKRSRYEMPFDTTRFIQKLHLDLGRKREVDFFKENNHDFNRRFDSYNLYDIEKDVSLYDDSLCDFIEIALKRNANKLKIFELCFKLVKSGSYGFLVIRRVLLTALRKNAFNSKVIVVVLKYCHFNRVVNESENLEDLEYFLHHVNILKRVKKMLSRAAMARSILLLNYRKTKLLLRYQKCLLINENSYLMLKDELIRNLKKSGLRRRTYQIKRTHKSFIAIVILIVFLNKSEESDEILRLLFRSTNMKFFCLKDFHEIYDQLLFAEEIEKVYSYYTDIIGQEVPGHQPRMLKQICRVKIRSVLYLNNNLFYGIDSLKLPEKLKMYLKLEE